jgi:hypothetical protein
MTGDEMDPTPAEASAAVGRYAEMVRTAGLDHATLAPSTRHGLFEIAKRDDLTAAVVDVLRRVRCLDLADGLTWRPSLRDRDTKRVPLPRRPPRAGFDRFGASGP